MISSPSQAVSAFDKISPVGKELSRVKITFEVSLHCAVSPDSTKRLKYVDTVKLPDVKSSEGTEASDQLFPSVDNSQV
jgi:hypothetical protein